MMSKIYCRVVIVYAVLAAMFAIFLGGAAIMARENALSPLDILTMRTQNAMIEANR